MTTIKQIREEIDTKLDKWEAQATALEAQLALSKEQATERLDAQKRKYEQVAQQVRDKIDAAADLAEDNKTKIKGSFEHMQVQLALGTADTRDAYQEWKQKFQTSAAAFETDVDVAVKETSAGLQSELDALKEDYVREADALEAEVEAMQAQFAEDKARAKADYEKYKSDLQSQIVSYKTELDDKRKIAAGKLDTFEAELTAGANQIKDAFTRLFS